MKGWTFSKNSDIADLEGQVCVVAPMGPKCPGGGWFENKGTLYQRLLFALAMDIIAEQEQQSAFKISADGEVAVSTVVRLSKDMTSCPRGAKVQLLGAGGVLSYGMYDGDPFWIEWAPLPRRAL